MRSNIPQNKRLLHRQSKGPYQPRDAGTRLCNRSFLTSVAGVVKLTAFLELCDLRLRRIARRLEAASCVLHSVGSIEIDRDKRSNKEDCRDPPNSFDRGSSR